MDELWISFDNPDGYQVVIEVDERVGYAYLLRDRQIVSDVWLFNRIEAPIEPEWEQGLAEPPFANSLNCAIPFENAAEVVESDFRVMFEPRAEPRRVSVYCRDQLLATMTEGVMPGESRCAVKDSPVATTLRPEEHKRPLTIDC